MFTWMKPDGRLDHAAIAPIVADLFLGGIGAVKSPDYAAIAAVKAAMEAQATQGSSDSVIQ
jgi:hypothetical protein